MCKVLASKGLSMFQFKINTISLFIKEKKKATITFVSSHEVILKFNTPAVYPTAVDLCFCCILDYTSISETHK